MAQGFWGPVMAQTLFKNVAVFDGSGDLPYQGEVLLQGNRIKRWRKVSIRFVPKAPPWWTPPERP